MPSAPFGDVPSAPFFSRQSPNSPLDADARGEVSRTIASTRAAPTWQVLDADHCQGPVLVPSIPAGTRSPRHRHRKLNLRTVRGPTWRTPWRTVGWNLQISDPAYLLHLLSPSALGACPL